MRYDCDGYDGSPYDGSGIVEIYLSGTGQTQISGYGDLVVGAVLLSGSGQIQISGIGELYIYAEITFTFGGTLAAGKTVVVNTNDFTVLNDGVNAIASMTGDFPEIYPGTNQVIYTDSLGSRTVNITIVKKDRSV